VTYATSRLYLERQIRITNPLPRTWVTRTCARRETQAHQATITFNKSNGVQFTPYILPKYFNKNILTNYCRNAPVPVAARSKASGSNPTGGMFVCCECCVLSGRGLFDKLITHPEESHRLWCVVVCDLEISRMRRPWPA